MLEYQAFYGPGVQQVYVPEDTEFLSAVLFGGQVRVYFLKGRGSFVTLQLAVLHDGDVPPRGSRHLASIADPSTTRLVGPFHVFVGGQ